MSWFSVGAWLLVSVTMQVVVDERGMVENPIYARWKNFAVGTEVHYLQHTQAPGAAERRLIIYRLLSRSDEQLTVEICTRLEGADATTESVRQQVSKRWFRLPPGVDAKQFGKPSNQSREGQEDVEILGRKLKTRWTVSQVRVEAGITETKTWTADEIPGGLVRSVSTTAAVKSTTTVELLELRESAAGDRAGQPR
jgi:hypothetical protein